MGGAAAPTWRTFVALEVGAALHEAFVQLLAGPVSRFHGLKRVRPEGLHLTLRFFGEARPEQVARIAATLASAASACPAGEAQATGLGVFPGRGAPRVLWVGLEVPAAVLALQQACEQAARAAGFAGEGRPFVPHVTLGRWRQHAPAPHLPALALPVARFEELVVYRSELGAGGARYTALHRLPLGGATPRD